MRFLAFVLFGLSLTGTNPTLAQGHHAMGGISGGGGIENGAELIGYDGNSILVRCRDQNIYRCDSRCSPRAGWDQSRALELFCMEVQGSY